MALPDAARSRKGAQKALLVEAIGDLLPREITAQRKRTFTLPWEQWLRGPRSDRGGPLRGRVEASLAEAAPALREYVRSEGARAVGRAFLAGGTSWSRPRALYVLNEWGRQQHGV